jgi:hypothetical protein
LDVHKYDVKVQDDYEYADVCRWILDIFWKGYKRDLETTDIFAPLHEHKSDYLGDKFEK